MGASPGAASCPATGRSWSTSNAHPRPVTAAAVTQADSGVVEVSITVADLQEKLVGWTDPTEPQWRAV